MEIEKALNLIRGAAMLQRITLREIFMPIPNGCKRRCVAVFRLPDDVANALYDYCLNNPVARIATDIDKVIDAIIEVIVSKRAELLAKKCGYDLIDVNVFSDKAIIVIVDEFDDYTTLSLSIPLREVVRDENDVVTIFEEVEPQRYTLLHDLYQYVVGDAH